jgi:hypothetical protein
MDLLDIFSLDGHLREIMLSKIEYADIESPDKTTFNGCEN